MKWRVLLTVGIGTFMSALNGSVVNAVLPLMRRGLQVDFATIEWVVTIYLLVVSGLLLLFGRLGDLRGHRTWFVYGLADVAGASLRRRVPRCRFGGRTGRRRVCHPRPGHSARGPPVIRISARALARIPRRAVAEDRQLARGPRRLSAGGLDELVIGRE